MAPERPADSPGQLPGELHSELRSQGHSQGHSDSGAPVPRGLWHRLTGFMSDDARPNSSLFGEILDWLWVPVMLLMPVSVLLTFAAAKSLSNAPFDRALSDSVSVLADQVKLRSGRVVADLPLPARDILRADDTDTVYFQVTGQRGEYVSGDRDLPLPSEDEVPLPGRVLFRNDEMQGVEVRIAYTWVRFPAVALEGAAAAAAGTAAAAPQVPAKGPVPVRRAPGGLVPAVRPPETRAAAAQTRPALVQVAETLDKRAQLADEIVKGVILPQFIILPLAAVLIWFGLARGLRPLSSLVRRIGQRRPGDLSPIPAGVVPAEVEPLIDSINHLMRQLDGSLRGQQRFIANAAHQLRTPLAGIQMQTELALRQVTTLPQGLERCGPDQRWPELRRSLEQMALSTRRLVRMVNQLLALTCAEEHAGGASAAPRLLPLDLVDLVRERVRDWVPAARARQIDLGFEADGNAPVRIAGNAPLLAELVNNLADNAIRYTPPGGMMTVRVRRLANPGAAAGRAFDGAPEGAPEGAPAARVLLEVEDSGIGIAPDERELVFERFYRVLGAGPAGEHAEGSGLGLAIVREIAQQHAATVRVRAGAQGRGSVFAVEFPCERPSGSALAGRAGALK